MMEVVARLTGGETDHEQALATLESSADTAQRNLVFKQSQLLDLFGQRFLDKAFSLKHVTSGDTQEPSLVVSTTNPLKPTLYLSDGWDDISSAATKPFDAVLESLIQHNDAADVAALSDLAAKVTARLEIMPDETAGVFAQANVAKGDQVIVNHGTANHPEFVVGIVTQVMPMKKRVRIRINSSETLLESVDKRPTGVIGFHSKTLKLPAKPELSIAEVLNRLDTTKWLSDHLLPKASLLKQLDKDVQKFRVSYQGPALTKLLSLLSPRLLRNRPDGAKREAYTEFVTRYLVATYPKSFAYVAGPLTMGNIPNSAATRSLIRNLTLAELPDSSVTKANDIIRGLPSQTAPVKDKDLVDNTLAYTLLTPEVRKFIAKYDADCKANAGYLYTTKVYDEVAEDLVIFEAITYVDYAVFDRTLNADKRISDGMSSGVEQLKITQHKDYTFDEDIGFWEYNLLLGDKSKFKDDAFI